MRYINLLTYLLTYLHQQRSRSCNRKAKYCIIWIDIKLPTIERYPEVYRIASKYLVKIKSVREQVSIIDDYCIR